MKYKVGDRVKVTTNHVFRHDVEELIYALNPERIFTIGKVFPKKEKHYNRGYGVYQLKEMNDHVWTWDEEWLEEIPKPKRYRPIKNRFEILDI